ncbi:MAG: SseB family protein [Pseudomonadota bacterium]
MPDTQPDTPPATPLDAAHATMEADPANDAARLRFYERLADAEVFLLLDREPLGDDLSPRVFDLDDGPVVLIFDLEERLAAFTGSTAPYAALPGRVVAQVLAGQGVGLGLNLGVAPSAMILPPDGLDWLAATLQALPAQVTGAPRSFHVPKGLPDALLQGLAARLDRSGPLATTALLAGVTYQDGRRGHMLAFVGARPGAEDALARAAAEALTFSGVEAGEMDVTFLAPDAAAVTNMARFALRFDLPVAVTPAEPAAPKAPGSDPDRPPILR